MLSIPGEELPGNECRIFSRISIKGSHLAAFDFHTVMFFGMVFWISGSVTYHFTIK